MLTEWHIKGSTLVHYDGDDSEIIIPDCITEIAKDAFRDNKKITSVFMPNRISKIGPRAFYGCTALQKVTITDVHVIDSYAFSGCTSLCNVSLPDHTMKTIGYCAFRKCTSLKSFVVPDGVKKISTGAFCRCTGLEKVILPGTLEKIRKYAFTKCSKLKSICLKSEHTYISPAAFHKCNPSISFKWENKESYEAAAQDGFDIDADGTLVSYFGRKADVLIPDGVSTVGWGCFSGNISVKTLITPPSLKTLQRNSLSWSSFEQIRLTGVETIEKDAIWGCYQLKTIDLPESLTFVGEDAIGNCFALTKLEFKNPRIVFKGTIASSAYALEKVIFPEGLSSIPAYAFYYCESLRECRIPETVKSIGKKAFVGSKALQEMTIPKGVKILDWNVFDGCTSLQEVILSGKDTVMTGRTDEFCTASVRHADEPRVKTMVLFMGIQGSGKTFYFNWHFAGKYTHVSLDEQHTRSKENLLIQECIEKGADFVIDNTNPTKADRARYIPIAKAAGYRIIGYFFESKIKECIERNNQRTGTQRLEPNVIAATSNRLEIPNYSEGFDELYYVEHSGRFYGYGDTTPMLKRDWKETL